jgi:Zn-dependent protease with chaperone function
MPVHRRSEREKLKENRPFADKHKLRETQLSKIANEFRGNRERVYHAAMIVGGALLWYAVFHFVFKHWTDPKLGRLSHLFVTYGLAFAIGAWLASGYYRAWAFGNMVLLGPTQFPELHDMVVEGAREIGLDKAPTTFLYNSNGLFNAFARRIFGGRFIFLTSALVEANNDAQVRFVIGHELGHHAAGHLNPWLNAIKLPAYGVPFLGKAYSRSREYTCDRIGAALSKDLGTSRRALQMLGCGCRRLNDSMNCEAFAAQEDQVPAIFGFLSEISRTHPRLTRRMDNISRHSNRMTIDGSNFVEPEFRIGEAAWRSSESSSVSADR